MSVTATPATYLDGFRTQPSEVCLEALDVTGAVPSWLTGTLVRNGPARYEVGERTLNHWFDGLAMLHAFGFADGRVSYANRYLRTDAYRAAEEGRIGHAEFATDPCRSIFARAMSLLIGDRRSSFPNANVNVVRLGERYLAMTETPLPVRFDPATLETLGVDRNAAPPTGQHATAHPHHDAERDELVAYVVRFGSRSHYVLYAVPAQPDDATAARSGEPGRRAGRSVARGRRTIASLPVERPSYMHSFALTPRYAVLTEFPIVVNPLKLALRARPFIENYRWKPDRPARFLVIDRHAGTLRGAYETDPFFAFHTINAFERDGEVVVDLCGYDDARIIRELYLDRARDPDAVLPRVEPRRYEIDLASGTVRHRTLADVQLELPRVAYRAVNGRPYRYAYGSSKREAGTPGFLDQVAKVDVESGAVATWREDGTYPGEPVFVPSPDGGGEDDGVLLSVVLDGRAATSFLLVLDARDLTELARAHVPQHVPFGFHGSYFG
jgi:beta,beta-carotene 9',10'-dioxygenase